MIVKSKKDSLFKIIFFAFSILLLTILYKILNKNSIDINDILSIIIVSLTLVLIFWVFYGTYYKINKNTFTYNSGPIRGSIDIQKINIIYKGKTKWVGFKTATALNGLIIKYNKFDEIYISPKSNDEFIKALLKINNNIKIID